MLAQPITLPKTPIEQRTTGAGGQDELLSLTTNWRGDIAALGNAARGKEGGQDISFVVFDAQLSLLVERHIGRKGDDGAGQIATLPDGRYVVAGYSTRPGGRNASRSQYFGKRDGWLLVLNEKGDTEGELLLGTAADDAFVSVAVCPDGSMWLAGNSGNQAWIVRVSAQLEVIWERKVQYHMLPTHATAATLTPNGEFFVLGGTAESGRKHLWVAGYGTDGQPVMETIYPNSQAESGSGIVAVDAQTLAIVGAVDDPRDRENGFISLLDRTGVMQRYNPLGGREYDRVNTLIRLCSGQLLTGGGSASFERGSRRISAWLTLLDKDGKEDKDQYYGSKLDDEALGLVEHPDGRLFAVGTTARQVLKMRQGWLFQLTKSGTAAAPPGSIRTTIYPLIQNDDDIFSPDERTFVPFQIENTGDQGQCLLRAEIKLVAAPNNVSLRMPAGRSVLLPPLAAHSRLNWGLPIQLAAGTPPGRYRVQVQFFQENNPLDEPKTVEIVLGERSKPQLVLSVTPPESGLVMGKEDFVLVEVQNTGTAPAQNLTLTPSAPAGVRLPTQVTLGDLAAGGTIRYKLPIVATNTATGTAALRLGLRVDDGNLLQTASTETQLDVTTPPNTPAANNGAYTVAVWVYPNPDNFERKELVWPQEEITVQVKIVSSQAVTRQQFCIEINGQPCQTGAKFDEVQIKGDRGSKTFSQQIRLREGENLIQANIQTPDGKVQSEPLKIAYSPAKPNLHIVSIGVPAADLRYTTKDARDFALSLASMQNSAFGKIFIDTLLSEERTTKTEIMKTLRRLQYRYTDLQILPKDLLVIFVSGHGLGAYDGSFRLAASDYDGPFMQETSLDFEMEVINYLQSIPCPKLFFVDACHSGTASSTGLAGIATRKNGLNMLVSCQPNEYSYEDDTWKNGAFTHALVQGFELFARQPASLDQNRDARLDVSELFGYIEKEVPALVDKKRPKVSTTQRPNLFLVNPGRPIVIFE
jgi:Caspase domain